MALKVLEFYDSFGAVHVLIKGHDLSLLLSLIQLLLCYVKGFNEGSYSLSLNVVLP